MLVSRSHLSIVSRFMTSIIYTVSFARWPCATSLIKNSLNNMHHGDISTVEAFRGVLGCLLPLTFGHRGPLSSFHTDHSLAESRRFSSLAHIFQSPENAWGVRGHLHDRRWGRRCPKVIAGWVALKFLWRTHWPTEFDGHQDCIRLQEGDHNCAQTRFGSVMRVYPYSKEINLIFLKNLWIFKDYNKILF